MSCRSRSSAKSCEGAADRVAAAGAVTLGGHTVRDSEIKFGLSVTGLVDPAAMLDQCRGAARTTSWC